MRVFVNAAAIAGLVLGAGIGDALADGLDDIVISASEGSGESVDTFATETPKIFVEADIGDLEAGSKITAAWIAVDSGGAAPPNYKIDEVTYDVGSVENHFTTSLTKPNNGWPVGSYAVELSVDGELEETVNFSVK